MMRLFLFCILVFSVSCSSKLEELRSTYRPASAREAYVHALNQTGIAQSAMALEWIQQGDNALSTQISPSLPFVENGVVDPLHVSALAYRLDLKRGQRLSASGSISTNSALFIDLFEIRDHNGLPTGRVASADSLFELSHDVTRTGSYVLRVQPEILAAGNFRIEIRTQASIIFPVVGKNVRSILSQFGAERDAGRRSHHGVDIFAKRGTPVIAVKKGRITSTKIGGLGGKTVWLRDNRGTNFYYAHLDSQMVAEGQQVMPGDTLGLVGNTGNARTTPPHLHFGVYARGPHDPWHYLYDSELAVAGARVDSLWFGKQVTLRSDILKTPNRRSDPIQTVSSPVTARVVGGSGDYFHVRLDSRTDGFIAGSNVALSLED